VQHAQNWRLERMAIIDRAVLRLAIYELRTKETPPKVVLNEAVDLAKKFSSEDAGAFVNGILDAVNKALLEKADGAK
jgi:N utilization substance protein B